MTLTVGWGDCDPAGIVFYPNYFRWFDDASWRLFEAGGLPHPDRPGRLKAGEIPVEVKAQFGAVERKA